MTPKQAESIAAYRAAQNGFKLALQQGTIWPTDFRDKSYNARTAYSYAMTRTAAAKLINTLTTTNDDL